MVWALDHNGTNQYSYTADDSIALSGDRYYEFKINTSTTNDQTIFCLCNDTGSGNSGEFLTITINFITTGKLKIETSGYTPGEGGITVNDGVDHTIRLEITGSFLELYVDNVLDYSTTHTNPSILDGNFGLYMGCSKYFYADDAFRFFDGLIWDVDVNNQYFYSATNSDHNQSTNLVDNIAANDAIMVNMTTANWIDLGGGNEYTITGDSSVTVIPSADFEIQRSYTIVGDVPVGLTPVADFLLNRSYSIGGQSSLELSPNSGFELNREYIFSGDVPFNILPNSETLYSSGNSIDGDVSYSVIPTALFEINRSYSIEGLTNIAFAVQSSKQKNINVVIDGNVPIEITPSANFQFGIENIIDGDVNFNITPDSSFVFNRQYVLNGSIGINLAPDSETETTKNYIYNGQSEVSFSVEGDFEFDGQKLINGDVQINVLPNSEMVLDRVQVIKDPLFTLSVEDEVITLSVESSVEVIYAVAR